MSRPMILEAVEQPLYDTEPLCPGGSVRLFVRPIGSPCARAGGAGVKTSSDTNMTKPGELPLGVNFHVRSIAAEAIGLSDASCLGIVATLTIGNRDFITVPWSRLILQGCDHDGMVYGHVLRQHPLSIGYMRQFSVRVTAPLCVAGGSVRVFLYGVESRLPQ